MEKNSFIVDQMEVRVFKDAEELGNAAASAIRVDLLRLIEKKGEISVMFAAAPSQDTTLNALKEYKDIPWEKVNAFHMDEYVGISSEVPQSFRNYLTRNFFSSCNFKSLNLLDAGQKNYKKVAEEYSDTLKEHGIDLIVLGIGENGHIAFNDPPEARFNEERWTKIVKLSLASRNQQVHDGCFLKLTDVPEYAVTVTIPAFLAATKLHCVVPGVLKAEAVRRTLEEPISENCPASVLRTRGGVTLYIDSESASKISR